MFQFAVDHRVGNFKTNKVGTLMSQLFKGASGEFHGFVVSTEKDGLEIWDQSAVVLLPPEFQKPDAAVPTSPA